MSQKALRADDGSDDPGRWHWRQPVFDELHRLSIEDAPMIVWTSGRTVGAHRTSVKGFTTWPGRAQRLWNVGIER